MIDSMLDEWRGHAALPGFLKAISCNTTEERLAAKRLADQFATMSRDLRPAIVCEAVAIWLYGTLGGLILSGIDSRRS